MKTHNNWLNYSFDGVLSGQRTSPSSAFNLHFNKTHSPLPYYEALYNNARMVRDSYSEPLDVLLSGGIDSEVVVRVFKDLGIKHNTYIFQLENNLNVRDVIAAEMLCDELNIPYSIIDFNLQRFFENDALSFFEKTLSPCSGRLARMAWFDYLDNIPIWCEGEPLWVKHKDNNWRIHYEERDFVLCTYADSIGRECVGQWWTFTPDISLSFHHISIVQSVITNKVDVTPASSISLQFPLDRSTWPLRDSVHRKLWPTIKDKPKLMGIEGPNGQPDGYVPKFMADFANKYTRRIPRPVWQYTVEEFEGMLLE